MDIITEAQVEEARLAHVQLVQERERQLAAERRAVREAKEAATHTIVWEKVPGSWSDYSATYTTDTHRISIRASKGRGVDDRKKARVYVDGEPDVDFTEAYAMQEANRLATVAASETGSGWYGKGAFPEEDKLFARLNKIIVDGKREIIASAVTETEELADLLAGLKLHFSRTAGCSCGCSPAFIASSHIKASIDGSTANVTDIFVSKKKEVAA